MYKTKLANSEECGEMTLMRYSHVHLLRNQISNFVVVLHVHFLTREQCQGIASRSMANR